MISTTLEEIGISPDELFEFLQNKRDPLLVFDLRPKDSFVAGHIDGSVHAVCDTHAKDAILPRIPKSTKMVLVCDDGTISGETAQMIKSYGFNDTYFLQGGIKNWDKDLVIKKEVDSIISAEDLWHELNFKDERNSNLLIDVREPNEFSEFKIPGSINIPLQDLFKSEVVAKIPKDKKIVTICPQGNRSMVAVFALARNGIEAKSLFGGLGAWWQVLSAKEIARSDKVKIIQVRKVGKGCLSYIISSNGEALVIDTVYPVEKYIEIARESGLKIRKVIDTHQHADHISAAKELARISGADLLMSAYEQYDFASRRLKDGDKIQIGSSEVKAIHTPGHTSGSLSYLLDDRYLFSGDVLFANGIGRPDLRDKAREFAGELYDTLQQLLNLPTNVMVLPAHHAEDNEEEEEEEVVNSANSLYTTIGKAKGFPLLQPKKKEEFVNTVVKTALPRPMNYERILQINKSAVPQKDSEIPELEMGPNRCAINNAS